MSKLYTLSSLTTPLARVNSHHWPCNRLKPMDRHVGTERAVWESMTIEPYTKEYNAILSKLYKVGDEITLIDDKIETLVIVSVDETGADMAVNRHSLPVRSTTYHGLYRRDARYWAGVDWT